jgi:predicted Zn finger-like uncharacterized protein
VKFLCEQCKAKYQIADDKAVGKTVRMKCRKCGHLIEVRAAVTESSVSSALPKKEESIAPVGAIMTIRPSPSPQAAAVPSPPRAREPQRPAGALEGAFKSAMHHGTAQQQPAPRRGPSQPSQEEESSTPFDMADLSPSDEWYVAINGVPVGPIRVAEVRRKAALGAVTDESLVWQEGLDEWRPLRLFPELAATIRDAKTRLSRPPPAEVRRSTIPPPPPAHAPSRPPSAMGASARLPPPRAAVPSLQRSNVVPIMSRLATAARLEPAFPDSPLAPPVPPAAAPRSVAPDPFGPSSAAAVAALPTAPAVPDISLPRPGRSPPWMALAMVAAAVAFGVTAAVALFLRPSEGPQSPAPLPSAALPVAAPAASAAAAAIAPTGEPAQPAALTPAPSARIAPTARTASPTVTGSSTATAAGRSLDLHSLAQSAPTITPTDDSANDAPRASGSGQGLTEAQIQQVMALHRTALSRVCWERNPSAKAVVNVNVLLTIAGDGTAQNVVASGDEASVAKCIENDIRGWRFPAMGSPQKTAIPFKFVRQ